MNLIFEFSKGTIYKYKDNQYDILTSIFRMVLDKRVPFKSKKLRGNQAPFMSKELSKAVMNKFKLRNRYPKWASCENCLVFKKQKNSCNNLCY